MKENNYKKTILFIRQTGIYYDSRATKIIETLSRNYKIIVLGWDREGDSREKIQSIHFSGMVSFHFFEEELKHGSGIKGIFKFIKFQNWIKKMLSCTKYDIIHCCDFDTGYVVYSYAKRKNIPYVYDIFDYYAEAHNVSIFRRLIVRLENKVINNSDGTIICSEQRKRQIAGSKPHKLIIIENSPDIAIYRENINFAKENVDVVYVGTLSHNRLLYEILSSSYLHPNVVFHIGGLGELESIIRQLSQENGNINYYGRMNYSDVIELEKKADFLFATYNPEISNHKYSAANKCYEAMALGKPIIVCKGTGMDEMVLDDNIGAVIDYDAEQFYDQINSLFCDKDKLVDISNNGEISFKKKHSWRIMENRLLDLYEGLLKGSKGNE